MDANPRTYKAARTTTVARAVARAAFTARPDGRPHQPHVAHAADLIGLASVRAETTREHVASRAVGSIAVRTRIGVTIERQVVGECNVAHRRR